MVDVVRRRKRLCLKGSCVCELANEWCGEANATHGSAMFVAKKKDRPCSSNLPANQSFGKRRLQHVLPRGTKPLERAGLDLIHVQYDVCPLYVCNMTSYQHYFSPGSSVETRGSRFTHRKEAKRSFWHARIPSKKDGDMVIGVANPNNIDYNNPSPRSL